VANEGKLTSEFVEVFATQAPAGRLTSEFAEVFVTQAPSGRLTSQFAEIFLTQAAMGRLTGFFVEVFLIPVPAATGVQRAQGIVAQGYVDQSGAAVPQGRSYATQGRSSQGAA
jgi:hypothetical protein